ncbi:MAG: CPBP family intramembrane glutamic endopeptidase [Planctomycetota bacterium]
MSRVLELAQSEADVSAGEATIAETTQQALDVASQPMGLVQVVSLLLSISILAVFLTCIGAWIRLIRRRISLTGERAILPARPRLPPTWTPVDGFFFWVALLVVSIVMGAAFQLLGWIDLRQGGDGDGGSASLSVAHLALSAFSMLAATLITLQILLLRRGDALERLGIIPKGADVKLGLMAAVLVLPPTMGLMGLVSMLVEYSHPVLDVLQPKDSEGPNLPVFALLFVTTAIVTPVVEEYWFRGLVQGGLQAFADFRNQWETPTTEATPPTQVDPATMPLAGAAMAAPETGPLPTDSESTAYAAFEAPVGESRGRSINDVTWTPTAMWPLFVSSLIFALMHWGHGLAPIPLFFLATALGYIYRQTGSLIPCILVHMVLNSLTMVVTLLQMLSPSVG